MQTVGTTDKEHNAFFSVEITAENGIELSPENPVQLSVKIENTTGFCGMPLWAEIRWLTSDGVVVEKGDEYAVFVNQEHCGVGRSFHKVTLSTETPISALSVQVCEISVKGYASRIYVPVTLVGTRG